MDDRYECFRALEDEFRRHGRNSEAQQHPGHLERLKPAPSVRRCRRVLITAPPRHVLIAESELGSFIAPCRPRCAGRMAQLLVAFAKCMPHAAVSRVVFVHTESHEHRPLSCLASSSNEGGAFRAFAPTGRLTPPSSGRPKGRFAPFAPPLMSNVRSHDASKALPP